MIRTHINAATTDDGARRRAYIAAAEKRGVSLNWLILQTLDEALIPKDVRAELPPLKRKGDDD